MTTWETITYLFKSTFLKRKYWSGDKFDYQFKKCVKRKYKNRCMVTGRTDQLVVHHLYDASSYPQWRSACWNGVLITKEIHEGFHKWMGGFHVSCTKQDFERYLRRKEYV